MTQTTRPASGDVLIEVKNLVNRFGDHTVHDGLELSLQRGENLGIIGGSGSGKSVLLRTMLGLHRPTAGEVLVNGRDLGKLAKKDIDDIEKTWGVLFQDGALFSGLTTLDNVAFPLREYTSLDDAAIENIALFKLQTTGLGPEVADRYPSSLSGGMVKRAGLARALALDPAILFLDEPTAGLDPLAAAAFDDLLLELRDILGLTVVIITHDLDTLVRVCDRIAMIVDKKIISGTLDDMMASTHPQIHEYFHGPRMHAAQATHRPATPSPAVPAQE